MLFLIDYHPPTGTLITLREFPDADQREAFAARLALELELKHRGTEREVVLFQADDQEALRRTHANYFYGPHTLVERFSSEVERVMNRVGQSPDQAITR